LTGLGAALVVVGVAGLAVGLDAGFVVVVLEAWVTGGVVTVGVRNGGNVGTDAGPNRSPPLELLGRPPDAAGSSSGGWEGISDGADDGLDEHAVVSQMAPAARTKGTTRCGDLTRTSGGPGGSSAQ
jgi:hypothetical protein